MIFRRDQTTKATLTAEEIAELDELDAEYEARRSRSPPQPSDARYAELRAENQRRVDAAALYGRRR
jgi:hypothetical protein